MRVTFVVTILDMSGGVRVVRDHAEYLVSRGHQVTIVEHSLPKRPVRARVRDAVRNFRAGMPNRRSPTFPMDPRIRIRRVDVHRTGWEEQFPDADVVIATWWLSCEHVALLPAAKGHKVHFVQDHEAFPGQPNARVKESIRLIPTKIAVSQWLAELMRGEYGFADTYLVGNGIDTNRFRAPCRTKKPTPIVGTVYSGAPRKNSPLAVEAVRLARQEIPALRLMAFGSVPLPPSLRGEAWATYHYLPRFEDIPSLYASCDLWLFTSLSEGFGLPLLEALACGTPVIATAAGAAPDLITGRNGALVQSSPEAMAREIVRICNLPQDEWASLSRDAAATGAAHGLKQSGAAFEAALASINGIGSTGPS